MSYLMTPQRNHTVGTQQNNNGAQKSQDITADEAVRLLIDQNCMLEKIGEKSSTHKQPQAVIHQEVPMQSSRISTENVVGVMSQNMTSFEAYKPTDFITTVRNTVHANRMISLLDEDTEANGITIEMRKHPTKQVQR